MDKYSGLLHKVINQNYLRSIKKETYSETYFGFYEAIMAYDESMGVPFAGFYKISAYLAKWTFRNNKDNDKEYLDLFKEKDDMKEKSYTK